MYVIDSPMTYYVDHFGSTLKKYSKHFLGLSDAIDTSVSSALQGFIPRLHIKSISDFSLQYISILDSLVLHSYRFYRLIG